MNKFDALYMKYLGEMTAASVGMGATGDGTGGDTYAPGDARLPGILGQKPAKKKKKVKKETKIPIQRRIFPPKM